MDCKKVFEKIEKSKVMASLYEDLSSAKERYKRLIENASQVFPEMDSPVFLSVPGRTEICGNHTDHQNGKVLASAVSLDTICLCEKNGKDVIRIFRTDTECPKLTFRS